MLFFQYHHLLMSFIVGIIATAISIAFLKPLANQVGLVDIPGGRKQHAKHVPLIGGICIFIGLCFGLVWFDISLYQYRGLIAGSAILLIIGVVDDFRELGPKARLMGQLVASLCLVTLGNLSVSHLGDLFFLGNIDLHKWAWVLTLLSVLLFINAMNMIDGHDGLAGSVVLGQLLYLLPLSLWFGQLNDVDVISLSALLTFVFLLFNFPVPWRKHADIFLGDAGSTFLGFLVAWFAVAFSQSMLSSDLHLPGYNLVTMLWILAYPLFDFLTVFFYRLCQKRSPLSPGREHLHHLLISSGMPSIAVTVTLFFLSAFLGSVGFVLAELGVHEAWQLQIYLFTFLIYLVACYILRKNANLAVSE